MNILISNDDGYLARGIALLARLAGEFANVRVVAPERNRSGASNSLTLDKPLRVRQAENGFYFVNGTPTDCIHTGLHVLPDFKPDWVFSGVNHGANMGDDTLYSGTVAAATEAYMMGIPAIAFSLAGHHMGTFTPTVEKAVWSVLTHVLRRLAWRCAAIPVLEAAARGKGLHPFVGFVAPTTGSPHPKSSLHFGFQGAGCFFGCAAAFATGRITSVGTAAQRRENR